MNPDLLLPLVPSLARAPHSRSCPFFLAPGYAERDPAWEKFAGANSPRFLEAARILAQKHGFAGGEVIPFEEGTMPVFALGERLVLKLFFPLFEEDFEHERFSLEVLADSGLPIPRPVEIGGFNGWKYIFMDRSPGEMVSKGFPNLPHQEKKTLLKNLGKQVRVLHGVSLKGSPDTFHFDFNLPDRNLYFCRRHRTSLDRVNAAR